ncbi:MAG: SPOR domain-containing protein, partial [Rhizobiales bacterium]|nr:SPOR domain-containing protein [Hyphomicrobiales bacterium]
PSKPTAVKTTAIAKPIIQAVPAPTFSGGTTPPATLAQPAQMLPPQQVQAQPPVQAQPYTLGTLPAGQMLPPLPAPSQQAVVQQPIRTASAAPIALPASVTAPAVAPRPVAQPKAEAPAARSGWMIQIGAFGAEKEAKSRLDVAQSKAKSVLGRAEPFVERASKGSSSIYRARFAGLDEKGAKEACRLLQRNDFDCMTIRN